MYHNKNNLADIRLTYRYGWKLVVQNSAIYYFLILESSLVSLSSLD